MKFQTIRDRTDTLRRSLNRDACLPPARVSIMENLPTPEELAELPSDEREQAFTEWENHHNRRLALERTNLSAAMIRISLCAFLFGTKLITNPAAERTHHRWCVCQEWLPNTIQTDI